MRAARPYRARRRVADTGGSALYLPGGSGAGIVAPPERAAGGRGNARIYGGDTGNWSEHATGNAVDVSAFVLEDGRRISVLGDWNDADEAAGFLHAARDAACDVFGTVLSPDYNAAHADHFHLDQEARGFGSFCR